MTYNQHRPANFEPGAEMLLEERDVQAALHEYRETGSIRDWVPTSVLYGVYKRHHFGSGGLASEGPEFFKFRQFAAVVAVVFPNTDPVRRTFEDNHVRGRAFLTGPLGLRMETNRGGNRKPRT